MIPNNHSANTDHTVILVLVFGTAHIYPYRTPFTVGSVYSDYVK
jgi:hypothetical protein